MCSQVWCRVIGREQDPFIDGPEMDQRRRLATDGLGRLDAHCRRFRRLQFRGGCQLNGQLVVSMICHDSCQAECAVRQPGFVFRNDGSYDGRGNKGPPAQRRRDGDFQRGGILRDGDDTLLDDAIGFHTQNQCASEGAFYNHLRRRARFVLRLIENYLQSLGLVQSDGVAFVWLAGSIEPGHCDAAGECVDGS